MATNKVQRWQLIIGIAVTIIVGLLLLLGIWWLLAAVWGLIKAHPLVSITLLVSTLGILFYLWGRSFLSLANSDK
jgi:uncharacterized membrane protein YkgB